MSMSKYATVADYEAARKTGKEKPIVDIKDVTTGKYWGGPHDVLFGTPINHPNERLNGEVIHTSKILGRTHNIVETQNTIYRVLNWKTPQTVN